MRASLCLLLCWPSSSSKSSLGCLPVSKAGAPVTPHPRAKAGTQGGQRQCALPLLFPIPPVLLRWNASRQCAWLGGSGFSVCFCVFLFCLVFFGLRANRCSGTGTRTRCAVRVCSRGRSVIRAVRPPLAGHHCAPNGSLVCRAPCILCEAALPPLSSPR
jgi:hypothetical protein